VTTKPIRYTVRCGLEKSGKVSVWDTKGGFTVSRHTKIALAQKRCDELNRTQPAEAYFTMTYERREAGWKSGALCGYNPGGSICCELSTHRTWTGAGLCDPHAWQCGHSGDTSAPCQECPK
jgi:hypothetical protein